MAIDTGKIFNIDIKDYFENPSKVDNLLNYNLVGVHCHKENISDFASLVPDEAEAVVNYQHNFFGAGSDCDRYLFQHHQIGVALIPKKK